MKYSQVQNTAIAQSVSDQINNPYSNSNTNNQPQNNERRSGSINRVQMKQYNNQEGRNAQQQMSRNIRENYQGSQDRDNNHVSEVYYAHSSQSPTKTVLSKASANSSQMSKIDLTKNALDSRIMLAQQTGQQTFLLETISSNESRFTSSPNFLARSKESFNPSHFGAVGGSGLVGQSIQGGFNNTQGSNLIQDFNNLGGGKHQMNSNIGGFIGTQVINVPTLGIGKNNHFESISYSASSEFGQHSLRSSVEQSNSNRGYHHMADQIKLEQYQVKNYQNPLTILEESKEEDVSFNKTITDQSPIPIRRLDAAHGLGVGGNLTGTGGVYFDNKSSLDDGTRSLLMHMRGVPGMESHENSGTLGSQALRNMSILGGGIAGNAKPNFNISSGSNNGNFLKFMGTTPNKSSTQFLHAQKFSSKIQDEELLEELGKATLQDPKASTQQQIMSSLQVSDELLGGSTSNKNERDDFNVIDEMGSVRQDLQSSEDKAFRESEFRDREGFQNQRGDRSRDRLDASQMGTNSNLGASQFSGKQSFNQYANTNLQLYSQTFKSGGQQQARANDPIRIDDNQFVTLNQIPEESHSSPFYGSRNQNFSGRPSNVSQYGGGPGAYYGYQNYGIGGGTFSDGQSSSNPTTNLNTPYQNQNQSRTVSPYPFTRREISNLSQASQKCQCCQAPIFSQNLHNRPLSGLSYIETKNLNFYEKNAQEQEVQTPKLESEVDQSTKIISNKGSEQLSSYKAVLCLDCQNKILNKENFTPIAPSDLRTSEFTNSNIMIKSQIRNFDEMQINSNLSSIHQQNTNLANSSIQPYSLQNPSQLNNLKFTSSLMGQSELQSSYLTQSNNNQQQQQNYLINPIHQHSAYQNFNSIDPHTISQLSSQPSHNKNDPQYNQLHPHHLSHPLQVNSLMQNSALGGGISSDSISNPALQSSSLHYLSYLSQNLGSHLKQSEQMMNQKYGSAISSSSNSDNYKVALKSFMNRQFERSAASGSTANDSGSVQYSRIFRERQTKRLFDQLQNIKADNVKSYEELEQLHTGLLLGKVGQLK